VMLHKSPGLSVARSWNKGLSLLFHDTAMEHVLVRNNDVELPTEMYRWLVQSSFEFPTGVGVDTREQMKAVADSAGAQAYLSSPHPDFSCYLMRRIVWEKVGGFDENMEGAFCEDWDYHVRLHVAGIQAMSIGLPFYHVGSATIKLMPDKARDSLSKQAEANRKYFKAKWGFGGGTPEYNDFFSHPYDGEPH
jgi:hypothetical protein